MLKRCIYILLISMGLTGCGQSGQLFLPGHPPPGYYQHHSFYGDNQHKTSSKTVDHKK